MSETHSQVSGSPDAVVLLLDDRPDDRELLATLLRYAGYAVIEAETGEDALRLAAERRPDLIISDILMPSMNGYEFVRRLRAEGQVAGTPVIFCTANYLEGEVRDLAASCGVSRFISKPCPAELVLETVAETLGHPESLPLPEAPGPEFEREQLRVINDKLVEKVAELEYVSAHRQQLLGLVMSAQEEERHRIADGIHDDSLQSVVAIGLRLGALRQRIEDRDALETLNGAQETVRLAAQRLRSLLFELRPPELDREGLASTLRTYLEHVRGEEGLEFELSAELLPEPEPGLREFLFRLAQEVLMNVRKHARARLVRVSLSSGDEMYNLGVQDDGVGFDPVEALRVRPGHLGLAALSERVELAGGTLRIDSAPGRGSTIEVRIPTGRRSAAVTSFG
jgi:signal transduction histidine kinase